jgi:hypothetical protein
MDRKGRAVRAVSASEVETFGLLVKGVNVEGWSRRQMLGAAGVKGLAAVELSTNLLGD